MGTDFLTELSALYEISSIPTSLISYDELGQLVLDKATRLLGTSVALLYRREGGGLVVQFWAVRGMPISEARGLPPKYEAIARTLDGGQPVILEGTDAVQALDVLPVNYAARYGLCLPIRAGDSFRALLCAFRLADNPFTRTELALFNVLADRVGTALENIRLTTEAERRYHEIQQEIAERLQAEAALQESEAAERRFQERLRTLIEVSNELSRTDSIDALCRQAVELGRARLGFDRLGIWFRSPDPGVVVGSCGTDERGNLRDERGTRLTVDSTQEEILAQKRPITLYWDDVDLVDEDGNVVSHGARAQAAMWDGEETIGFISIDNLLQRRPITDHDRELLNLYASTLGYLCSRKRAEEALANERTLLRAIIDILPILVYAKDTACRKILANRVDLEYIGASTEAEALGKTDFDFYPKDMAARFYARDQAIMQTGQPLIDYEHTIITGDGRQRWLLTSKVPLRDSTGQVIGLVGVGRDVTERKQAEEALQQYAERLRVLHAIDGTILAAWSVKDVAGAAARHVGELVRCRRVSVMEFDFQAGKVTTLAAYTRGETMYPSGKCFPLEEFVGGIELLGQGQIHVVEDASSLSLPPAAIQAMQLEGLRSYINVPLLIEGELIGALSLGAEHAGAFASEHIDIAREVADQVAVALRQARLHEQIQRHAKELERQVTARTAELARRSGQLQVAAEVARDATTAHSLDDLLTRAADLIRERFGFYHAGIFLTDERGEYAVLRAATGEAGRHVLERGHRLEVGKVGIVGYVTGTGEPRIALDVGADATHFDNPFLPDTRSEMALPLRVGERVIGALDVQSTREAAFDDEDVSILQVLADQLAVAIERTRLFEQVQATLEERLRTVISNLPVMLYALDRQGLFTLSEGKGLELLGLKPSEVVGRSAFDLFHDVPEIQEHFRRALAGETPNATVQVGKWVFETWHSPLYGPTGEVAGVIGVATDITERKRLEERVQRQERLAAVGQLAGGIAHDFNNFLTSITLYAHLLLRKESQYPDVAPIAQTILSEAQRAAQLVRQVLDFSRRSVMEVQPIDLAAFIQEIIEILRKTLPEHVRLVTDVEAGEHVVNADPTRIQQVVMNLALNARDAMPEGGELRIGVTRVETRSGEGLPGVSIAAAEVPVREWVCLTVSDSGTGMTEEVRAHLFEPFFTTKGPKGTGLGLAQVHGIVEQHGGQIGVETEPERGTTFRVYLPAYSGKEAPETILMEAPATAPEGKGEIILFVEDEERVRDAGQALLESLGYRVLTAANGREALEMYRVVEGPRLGRPTGQAGKPGRGIDLVLTDMVMPEMGGKELIRALRQINPDVKALAITGYVMQEDVQELREQGFLDIVHKPFDANVLAVALRRILDAE